MGAEAMCSECGKVVWLSWPDVQTCPRSTICEECEEQSKFDLKQWGQSEKSPFSPS
jgi:hypothetical protein